ncbi:MAG: class I mannose-6-phosphate isomerase [Firmicutes bacterium]|nr:class I mannose-6-phosphate isomerase [Bacillota bacterium]
MKRYQRYNTIYDRYPTTKMPTPFFVFKDAAAILNQLKLLPKKNLAFDVYPGANVLPLIELLKDDYTIIRLEEDYVSSSVIDALVAPYLTNDRVFGKMNPIRLVDYYPHSHIEKTKRRVKAAIKPVVIVGLGASLVDNQAIKVFVDCPRWELQLQFRQGGSNFHTHNPNEDWLKKYKRGFFLDWVLGDAYKFEHFDQFHYFIDVGNAQSPTMIDQRSMQLAIARLSHQPFRLVPYFDPGVWGGQWMKEVCQLPEGPKNYAWSFDGVPEENAVRVADDHHVFSMPAQNLVYFGKATLLGQHVYQRFGSYFPIRFDFLDTMQGDHLSLQVHPKTKYIQETFGMPFTQDESYYILDCESDGTVYLGLKDGINQEEFWQTLTLANEGKLTSPAIEKYVNCYPVKRHDHVSIPAGTIHCSGKNTMVLEISATPYIFTFKLWDWSRLGLDGKPRPVHLEHGKANLDWTITTQFVETELMKKPEMIRDREEKTGLHHTQFIETRRLTFDANEPILVNTHESVNMANLVEGDEIEIHPIDASIPPLVIHYAETFIVPASVKRYYLKKRTPGKAMVIQAFVRSL